MPDSAGPAGATPLEGLLDAARNTHAEAVVTALRQLREAFEDDSPPGKCVGVVRQFFVLSAKQGNVLFEAWERHGAEKAASRVVVYVLAAAAALFRASRLSIHTPSKSLTAGTGLPSKAGKAFEEMKRANLQDARAMAKTVLQSRPGAVLAILSARGADRAILAMLGLLTGDPSHCTCGVERRGEFGALGPRVGCFLAPGSGLGLVGTASSRR